MRRFLVFPLISGVLILLSLLSHSNAAAQASGAVVRTGDWSASPVQHVYGFPGSTPKEKGILRISQTDLSFAGKSGNFSIPLQSVLAVGSGNQRVELWGMKGRLFRMVIPNGGGLAAAAFMHHRVDMLTIEFSDSKGAYHGAVFVLPAEEVTRAVEILASRSTMRQVLPVSGCTSGWVGFRTVRVALPTWGETDVPVAYRALVYEHLIDRLSRMKGVEHVYRDGDNVFQGGCPQFTVQVSVTGFKEGSQVKRASMGPVGMFVGTTQMVFDLRINDAGSHMDYHNQIKATVRGESESMNVADTVAKKIVKQFAGAQKTTKEANPKGASLSSGFGAVADGAKKQG